MAEALISALIKELASLALQRGEEEVSLVKDVDEDVGKLKSNLESVQGVLEDAEKRQLTGLSVRNWLDKLKDVSFDMDNVMDKWSTALLKLKIEREGHQIVPLQTNKVCFSVLSVFSYFTSKVNRITLCREVAHKIKDLNKKLDLIAAEKDRYMLNMTTNEQPLVRPKTTSFIDEAEIEGREEEKDILVSKLLCENSTHLGNRGLDIIPIVGMGGLGKTTLAQLAYNNEKVLTHFDKRIWVCVSDPFDEMKVSKAIIEAIEGNAPNTNELETLLQYVRKCIEGKRFLLILDDVWTKDNNRWEQLKQPLKFGAAGSRILVTTRKREVAIMMGATHGMITLEKLSEEHCWLIFKRLAFLERKEEECVELEEVGRKIASKGKGLPLVAKTLGSLMCFKQTKTQWEDVLNSELWRSKDVEEIFTPFLLSYYDLSAKEKHCFLYCSVFPKNHRIQRNQLIEMWMSQSYLNHGTNSEEEGRECFENLVMRSFFQNFEKNGSDGSITHCKMHDIVHDFAQFVTKNECITIEVDKVEKKLKLLDEKTRHLTLVVGSHAQLPAMKFNKMNEKNLRTLFVVSYRYDSSIDISLFLHLTCLRLLTLTGCGLKTLPDGIGRLVQLRYLDLMLNPLVELPDSLCNLCNLQTLNLTGCYLLRKLPEGMGKLVNLKHLYIGWCHALEGLPRGIGRLSLRTLDTLVVPENKGVYFDIEDLKMLKNLRLTGHFYIKGCGNLEDSDEAEKIDLKNSLQVVGLFLYFGKLSKRNRLEDDISVLEALEPHQNLERLRIEGYMGHTVSPKWMVSLTNLRQLNLYDCGNCILLPSLGELPFLEVFRTRTMKNVKKVDIKFLGITEREREDGATKRDNPLYSPNPIVSFPKLETLDFQHFEQWEKWEAIAEETEPTVVMPCLRFLQFGGCPRLQVLPEFLQTMTSLKELSIHESEILEQCCRKRTGNEWAKISHVPNIKVNDEYVRKHGIWIQEDDNVLE